MTDKKTFYDNRWNEWNDMIRFSPAPRLRRSTVLKWAKALPCRSMLDVGCGNGEFLVEASRTLPAVALAGADISAAVVEQNRQRLPGMSFHTLDLNNGTLAETFDLVVSMEVVEHCEDYRTAVAHLAAMSRRWIILTVPCGPLFEIDRRVGHTRHFRKGEINEALQSAGFRTVSAYEWGFPFFNLYKHLINLSPDRMCESFLSPKSYGPGQKFFAQAVYASFRMSLPFGGYQLFVLAERSKQ